ncbi:T9SS type A sorting domain-containing protein, partial [bacterium]|nr:T9SS type A sorting domain-containing protein [bacterium]
GSGMDSVYCFSLEGEKITYWKGPYRTNTALTWDPEREVLWIAERPSGEILAYDREGNQILEINGHDLRTYGLAYFPDDPDEFTLYLFVDDNNEYRQGVYKLNPETEEIRFVTSLANPDNGSALGCCITNRFDLYSWVFMGMINNAGNDRVEIYQVAASMTWVQSDILEGRLEAQQSQDLTMAITIPDMPADTALCDLVFEHNTTAMETVVRLTAVRTDSYIDDQMGIIPTEFTVSDAYPNPFNSTSVISYTVPQTGIVNAELYDISGRAISTLISERQSAGTYQAVIDGNNLPAGLYLFRITAGNQSEIRKIALVK